MVSQFRRLCHCLLVSRVYIFFFFVNISYIFLIFLTSILTYSAIFSPSYSLVPKITRLRMPLPNVNKPCPLLFWLVIVLFHCRATSPAQNALASPFIPPPTHAVTSPGLNGVSRDKTSLVVTQCLGLPPLYSHPTKPLSVHYALNLFFHAQNPAPFTLC